MTFQAASHLAITAYCHTRSSVVGVSVCLLITFVSLVKTAEQIEMPFGMLTRVDPRNRVSDPQGKGAFEGSGCHSEAITADRLQWLNIPTDRSWPQQYTCIVR